MEQLDRILATAAGRIEPWYVLLPIAGGTPVYRERVYCYELYHQMRCEWPEGCRYYLNGEVHKGGHPILTKLVGPVMPDFLVHTPGDFPEHNHAVIEVKPPDVSDDGIRTDLQKLDNFMTNVHYDRVIYLIYGSGDNDRGWVKRVGDLMAEKRHAARIELWLHRAVGCDAAKVYTFGE